MPRIIRGGLIQTSVTHEGTAPLETIKKAMIDKTMGLIEEAARKGCSPFTKWTGPAFTITPPR